MNGDETGDRAGREARDLGAGGTESSTARVLGAMRRYLASESYHELQEERRERRARPRSEPRKGEK